MGRAKPDQGFEFAGPSVWTRPIVIPPPTRRRLVVGLVIGGYVALMVARSAFGWRPWSLVPLVLIPYLAWLRSALRQRRPPTRLMRRAGRRLTDAGRWLGASPAELDKSTLGSLLANRLRREPGLHVVPPTGPDPTRPSTAHDLYDREVDG